MNLIMSYYKLEVICRGIIGWRNLENVKILFVCQMLFNNVTKCVIKKNFQMMLTIVTLFATNFMKKMLDYLISDKS